jgi:hypothetical protein
LQFISIYYNKKSEFSNKKRILFTVLYFRFQVVSLKNTEISAGPGGGGEIEIEFVLVPEDTIVFPGFIGNVFRGALGKTLRNLTCAFKGKNCIDCLIRDIFKLFLELSDKTKVSEYLEVLLRYLFDSPGEYNKEELHEQVTSMLEEGGDIMQTIAQQFNRVFLFSSGLSAG